MTAEIFRTYDYNSPQNVLNFLFTGELKKPEDFKRELPIFLRLGVIQIRELFLAVVGVEQRGSLNERLMVGISVAFYGTNNPEVTSPDLDDITLPRRSLGSRGNIKYPFTPFQSPADHLADLFADVISPGSELPAYRPSMEELMAEQRKQLAWETSNGGDGQV